MGRKPNNANNFWANVDVRSSGECWPWLGGKHRDGYGKCQWYGKTVFTHRLAYELTYGPIPEGEGYHGTVIRHRCDNKICCNPNHLLAGTATDNNRDTVERNRHRFVSNPPKGEASPKAKLQVTDVLLIRELYATGNYSLKELGKRFGVTGDAIYRIVKRDNWKHI